MVPIASKLAAYHCQVHVIEAAELESKAMGYGQSQPVNGPGNRAHSEPRNDHRVQLEDESDSNEEPEKAEDKKNRATTGAINNQASLAEEELDGEEESESGESTEDSSIEHKAMDTEQISSEERLNGDGESVPKYGARNSLQYNVGRNPRTFTDQELDKYKGWFQSAFRFHQRGTVPPNGLPQPSIHFLMCQFPEVYKTLRRDGIWTYESSAAARHLAGLEEGFPSKYSGMLYKSFKFT